MRKIAQASLLAVAGLSLLAAPSIGARERLSGQEQLAKMIGDRVPGEGRDCLDTYMRSGMTIIDKTAIVFRDGRTLWVNVPNNPDKLDEDDILVTRQFGTSLCRQDIVSTYDRNGDFFTGAVFLNDFVPYRKPEAAK